MSSGPIDLATLGIEVDASGAVEGAAQLRTLIPAAEGAEAAVEGLEAAAESATARLRANAEATVALRTRMGELQGTAKALAESVYGQSDAVDRVATSYGNLITRVGLVGRELEQFNALQRAGADAADLQGVQIAQLAGQYYDLAEAAKAAGSAERARTQQAGSQYQQRLNENFGITRPVGDDKQRYPSSARDSARTFQEAADEAEAAAKQAAAYADQADKLRARISPLVGVQQNYNRELEQAQKLMDAGALSATEYAQAVALAGQNRAAGVANLLQGAVGGSGEADAKAAARDAQLYASEADALRARLDPLVKIQQEFNAELARADRLFDAGKISANEYAQALALADRNQAEKTTKLNEPSLRQEDALDARAQALMGDLDPRINAQNKYNAAMKEAGELFRAGRITADAYAMAQDRAKQAQDSFNGKLDEMGKKAGLSGQQMFWLLANVKDFANQVFAGGSVITAGMQQGPMLAQILGMAEGGFGAGLKSVADMLGRIALSAWGAAAGVTAAVGAVAALEYRGDAIRSGNSRATYGVGRRTGMTGAEIGQAANENADYSTAFGGSAARDAAQELAKSGNIARDSFKSVLGVVKDYAYTTDQEAGPAAKELADALDGSSSGVDKLNAKLGFLNSSTRETYLQMVASGDKTNAQKLLIDALVPTLERANERLNIFQKTWNLLKNTVGGAIDAAATGLDNAITGGSLDQQLATAEATLAEAQKRKQAQAPSALRSFFDSFGAQDGGMVPQSKIEVDTEEAQRDVDKLRQKIADFAKATETAVKAARSIDADNIVKSMNPIDEQLKKISANSSNLQQALSSLSVPSDKIKETELAVAALARQTQQLAADARMGGTALAEMVRSAQQGVSTVGFTDIGKQIADREEAAQKQIRDLNASGQNSNLTDTAKQDAARQSILNNNDLTGPEKNQEIQNLSATIDGYKASMESIQKARDLDIQKIVETQKINLTKQGGALSAAPPAIGAMIEATANKYKTFTPDVFASLVRIESNFNPKADANLNFPDSHAYGLTQIQPRTARGLGMSEEQRLNDPAAQLDFGGKLLDMLMKKYKNIDVALAAYHDGEPKTDAAIAATGVPMAAGRAYALKVQRGSGQGGGQSTLARAEQSDALVTEARQTRDLAAAEKAYAGRPQELELAKANIKSYYEEMKRSGDVAAPVSQEFKRLNSELVKSQLTASGVRVGNDLQFEREQIGRTSGEQKIASTLRSNQIGADTATGQALTAQMQYNEALTTAKGLATDTWGSISQGIMSGASATDIAISALGRLESKLLQMAGDELIAKLFKGLTGSGEGSSSGGLGGLGGFFGKLFGSGGGSGGAAAAGAGGLDIGITSWMPSFADGGIMTSKGKAPLRAYSSGGIATSPQTALFGEGSRPEAYVPLPDGRSIPVTMDRRNDSPASSGPVSLSATVYMNGSSGDPAVDSQHSDESARKMRETLQNMHDEMIAKDTRPGGALYRSGARRSA